MPDWTSGRFSERNTLGAQKTPTIRAQRTQVADATVVIFPHCLTLPALITRRADIWKAEVLPEPFWEYQLPAASFCFLPLRAASHVKIPWDERHLCSPNANICIPFAYLSQAVLCWQCEDWKGWGATWELLQPLAGCTPGLMVAGTTMQWFLRAKDVLGWVSANVHNPDKIPRNFINDHLVCQDTFSTRPSWQDVLSQQIFLAPTNRISHIPTWKMPWFHDCKLEGRGGLQFQPVGLASRRIRNLLFIYRVPPNKCTVCSNCSVQPRLIFNPRGQAAQIYAVGLLALAPHCLMIRRRCTGQFVLPIVWQKSMIGSQFLHHSSSNRTGQPLALNASQSRARTSREGKRVPGPRDPYSLYPNLLAKSPCGSVWVITSDIVFLAVVKYIPLAFWGAVALITMTLYYPPQQETETNRAHLSACSQQF